MNRILIVSSSLNMGGAQKMISNITTNLPAEWEADILLNSDKNIQFPYRGKIISLNIREPKDRQNLFYQFKVLIGRVYMLRRLKREGKYKACISLLDSANVANVVTGNAKCKTIITAVVNMSESANIKVYKHIVFPLIRLFYNRADCIVAQNADIRDDLIDNFGLKKELFSIIYNGIDTNAIEEICKRPLDKIEKEWFIKDKTIITAGRLTYAKGQWHLLRAFSRVLEIIPDAKLVVFGEGELREYLAELIEGYGISQNACIMGFNPLLDKYISNSAVFVLPSMLEGMPTVLLEAMACSVPSIVTDFKSGAREIMDYPQDEILTGIVKTNSGIITPVCSGQYHTCDCPLEIEEEILANAIIDILLDENYRKKYGILSKRRSLQFDMKNLIDQWIQVIES